jgi:hypothetical protein
MEQKKDKKDLVAWLTPYQEKVRISEEDLAWLKKSREDLSIAGFLHFVIQTYKANQK